MLPGIALPVLLAFGLSRLFALVGIQDVALLFATLVALTTVVGLVLLASSAAPLDRAHEALAASRAETRELVQQAPDGIFVADLDGRYTDVNRAGCEMLGFSREELVGKTIVDLIPPEDVGRLAASKQHLLAGKAEVSEWRLLRKDATYLPVELNAKILAGRPLAGFRARHQRSQTRRGRAPAHHRAPPAVRGAVSAHLRGGTDRRGARRARRALRPRQPGALRHPRVHGRGAGTALVSGDHAAGGPSNQPQDGRAGQPRRGSEVPPRETLHPQERQRRHHLRERLDRPR